MIRKNFDCVILILSALMAWSSAGYATVESIETGEVTQSNSEPNPLKESLDCGAKEEDFQKYLLEIISIAQVKLQNSYACFSDGVIAMDEDCKQQRDREQSQLQRVRKHLKTLYQEMADNWFQKQISIGHEGAKTCFSEGSQKIQLKDSSLRTLEVFGMYTLCQGLVADWNLGLAERLQKVFEQKEPPAEIPKEDWLELQNYMKSSFKKTMDVRALYDSRLTKDELRAMQAATYNNMAHAVYKFRKKIAGLDNDNRYVLFDFQSQWKSFLEQQQNPKEYETCQKSSRWYKDCFTQVGSQGWRCLNRLGNLTREMFAIVPMVDAVMEFDDLQGARLSKVYSPQEAREKANDLAVKTVFGIGALGGVGKIMRWSMLKAGRLLARQKIPRSFKMSNCKSFRLCKVTTVKVSGDAIDHISAHIPVSPEFLTQELRDSVSNFQGSLPDYKKLADRIKELQSQLSSGALDGKDRKTANRLLAESQKSLKDMVGKDLQSSVSREGKPMTSILLDNRSLSEVLSGVSKANVKALKDSGGSTLYKFVDGKTEFKMWVCRRPPCKVDGETILEKDQIMTLFPKCGAGVARRINMKELMGVLSQGVKAMGFDDIYVPVPCD